MKRLSQTIATALAKAWAELEGLVLVRAVLTGPARGRVCVSSSFGAEAAVLLDLVAQVDAATPVIFADTGKLFKETLAYRDRLVDHFGLTDVRTVHPEPECIACEDPHGTLYASDPDACCALRKIAPYAQAVAPFDVVISGRKRFHGAERTELPTAEVGPGYIKVNPLAPWPEAAIESHLEGRNLPRHPLVGEGFRSIGCESCTRKVDASEGARAGRWCGHEKTECGIHTTSWRKPNDAAPDPVNDTHPLSSGAA